MNTQHNPRRHPHRTAVLASAAVTVIAPLGILWSSTSASAAATPPETGCAAGFQTLSVSWLESQGPYQVPARIDDPANGGNGDQLVCGKPFNAASTAQLCGTPCNVPVLYLFADNNLTPLH